MSNGSAQVRIDLGDGNISPDVDLSSLLDQRWKKADPYFFLFRRRLPCGSEARGDRPTGLCERRATGANHARVSGSAGGGGKDD